MKIAARKMKDADVSFISLVARGANRIPFRVIKQENSMSKAFAGLDLGTFFTKKAETGPVVVGVVAMKGDTLESVKKQIVDAGFSVEAATEMEDGSVVFKQGEFEGEGEVIRLNEHVALITKGFSSYSLDGTDSTFEEMAKANGFYSGLSSSMSTLTDVVNAALRTSATPEEAKKAVGKVFDEARQYVMSLVTALPVKAFKLEGVIPEVAVKEAEADPVVEVNGTEEASATVATGTEQGADAAEVTAEEVPTETVAKEETVASAEPAAVTAITAEEVSAIVAKQLATVSTDMVAKMEQLLAGVTVVNKSIETMQADMGTMATRVAQAEFVAKTARLAVEGTVLGGAEGTGDSVNIVAKKDRGQTSREIDTAYMPQARSRTKAVN